MKLYQYRGTPDTAALEHLCNLLSKGELMFQKPENFNDPFDCYPDTFSEAPVGTLPHAVIDSVSATMQRAMGQLHGVACLTPHPDKMLMWSHYGDQHRGFCVGFDSDVLENKVPKNDTGMPAYEGPIKVNYTSERPSGEAVYVTKSLEWEYEDEHRLISRNGPGAPAWGPGVWCVEPEAVVEVVLGARMTAQCEAEVVSAVRKLRPAVKLRKALPHSHEYKIVVEDLDAQPQVAPGSGVIRDANENWKKF